MILCLSVTGDQTSSLVQIWLLAIYPQIVVAKPRDHTYEYTTMMLKRVYEIIIWLYAMNVITSLAAVMTCISTH